VRPARRFLHVCYCCSDPVPVVGFFVDRLAMRNTMNTPGEWTSGAILGLDRDVLTSASFVYDSRGPRTSPAIEVQGWEEPALVGTPPTDLAAVGLHALGVAVPAIAGAAASLGCRLVGTGVSPFGDPWVTVRDVNGVTLDLVEDTNVPEGASRMRHLRATVTDLAASTAWYQGLGFDLVDSAAMTDASFLGADGDVEAQVARLRLRDEPFEALLIEWARPRSHGRHVRDPNHAGLYRAAVAVDDTRAAYGELLAAGWQFDRPPVEVELHGTPVPDMWICFLSDPDGIPFEFVGRPRAQFRP
jgi:catechol 2,3-dioxygenase-like lactoylglutathione lyase family enzyme